MYSPEQIAKIMEGPAAKPPPGVIPNFEDPEDSNKKITILCILAAVIGTPFVGIRLYTRWVLIRRVLFEDVCLLMGALLSGFGLELTVLRTMPLHYGAHQWNIPYKNLIKYLTLAHAATLMFNVIMLLLRLAIIVQIMRAFVPPRTRNFTFWAACGLIVANVMFWATITMLEIFSCTPREKLWNPIVEGKCIDRHAYQVASAVMNMASEMLILLLPQRVIWNLSLTRTQRLGLSLLFALGIATIASSTLRLAYTIKLWPTNDITYFIADGITLWTIPEITCSLLVPCLPVIPQFIKMMRGNRMTSRRSANVMFGTPKTPGRRGDHKKSVPASRDKFVIRKTTEFLVSDIEYHELVNRPNMSVHSEEGEPSAGWLREPSNVHVGRAKPDYNDMIADLGITTIRRNDDDKHKSRGMFTSLP
ncbi:hypothetical protein CC80DRAFT_495977 [Byssothecium circinans]|uniref:Rhodopsin domain-containing protein n=1 Tax=Byssothecium circinans TaxID=147558 RepID=A0A6A5TGU7_9PLEO|nr:hypothetical protein CC80DRAFT_495977 [Byssothecium circinans]